MTQVCLKVDQTTYGTQQHLHNAHYGRIINFDLKIATFSKYIQHGLNVRKSNISTIERETLI